MKKKSVSSSATVSEKRHGHARPTLHSRLCASDDDGLQELVVLALAVPLLDGPDGIRARLAFTRDQSLHANLDTVPALVAVHDVVPTHDRCDLARAQFLGPVQQLLHVRRGRLGVGVASIAEEVDVDVRHGHLLGDLQQREEVFDVRVLW